MKRSNLAETQKSVNGSTRIKEYQNADPEYKMSTGSPEAYRENGKPVFTDAPDELLAGLYVSKGTEWAFNELVNRYSCRIYKVAYKITKDESNANDVLQEVFLTLFQKLDTFRGESKFSTWVYRITKNTSYLYLRKQRKHLNNLSLSGESDREEGALPDFQLEDWRFIPDSVMIEDERRYKVDEAMNGIPEIYSNVLRLRDIEGYTNIEIGEILGISLPAVKSRVRRGRVLLRKSLAEFGGEKLY